jgi:hypothetical protein
MTLASGVGALIRKKQTVRSTVALMKALPLTLGAWMVLAVFIVLSNLALP